jgi:CBS domain-containing protein
MEVVMNVSDILRHRKGTRIATVRMHETVATAARLLAAEETGALVVNDVCGTEGNVAVGILTAQDVSRALAEHGNAGLALKVSALISVQQLVSCSSADALDDVRPLMRARHLRHLPVIDDYTLIGVISLDDIERAEHGHDFCPSSLAGAQQPSQVHRL